MEVSAEQLRDYLAGREPRALLDRIEAGTETGPIAEALAAGIKKVAKEGEPDCFTLPETWRFATRRDAGRSRLAFLRAHIPEGAVIVDASCGIGLMLRELADLKPSKLVGIELDPVSAELARTNIALFGIEAEIHVLDATSLDAGTILASADLVFCDPERTASAKERTLEENAPSYAHLARICTRLAYEVSPQVDIESLPGDAVLELYSERRRHARTTIYSGFDAPAARRVVSDRGESVEGAPQPFAPGELGSGSELELLDPTVVAAGLAHRFGVFAEHEGKHIRLVSSLSGEQFIEEFGIIERGSIAQLKAAAIELDDFGRIALRFSVDPSEYWPIANSIRPSGRGSRTIHVFKVTGEYVMCEPIP